MASPTGQAVVLMTLALVAGAFLAAQGPILGQLASHVGGRIQAAAVAFGIGLVVLLTFCGFSGKLPEVRGLLVMPPILWAAGLIGTALLVLTLYAVPRIGVAVFTASVVTGQLVAALWMDKSGWLGLEARMVRPRDIVGIVLLLSGLIALVGGRDHEAP